MFAVTESVRSLRWVAITVGRDKAAVQVRHHSHLIAQGGQAGVDWNPVRVSGGKIVRKVHQERSAALRDDRHPERAGLTRKPRAVVVRPQRCGRQLRMKLPGDLSLGERIPVERARRRHDDAHSGQRHVLDVFRKLATGRGACVRNANRPWHSERAAGYQTVLQNPPSCDSLHVPLPHELEGTNHPPACPRSAATTRHGLPIALI